MAQVARAFVWQLIARVGEETFAQGLLPSEQEKLARSETTIGAMLVIGNLVSAGSTLIAPAALLVWILIGRGPGQRLLRYSLGGPRGGKLLVTRAVESGMIRKLPTQELAAS
jgi:hypothetical protein